MQATEEKPGASSQSRSGHLDSPWAFYLVVSAIGSVTVAFLIVMWMFSGLEVFDKDNAANITAALSSLFGIVGTLVGAYFGIKATTDAQVKAESTHNQALAANQRTVADAQKATTEATQQTAQTAREALSQQTNMAQRVAEATGTPGTTRGAPQATFAPQTLATLVPLATTAGLLIGLRYLRKLQKSG